MHSYKRSVNQIFKLELLLYQRRKSFDQGFILSLLVRRIDDAPQLLLQWLNFQVPGNTRSQGHLYTYSK